MNNRLPAQFRFSDTKWTPGGEIFDTAIYDTPNLGRQEFYDFGKLKELSKSELQKFVKGFNSDMVRLGSLYVERTVPEEMPKRIYGKLKLELSFDSDYRQEIPVLKLTVTNLSRLRKAVISIRPDEFNQFKIWDQALSLDSPVKPKMN